MIQLSLETGHPSTRSLGGGQSGTGISGAWWAAVAADGWSDWGSGGV